jgi:hypothetical protein
MKKNTPGYVCPHCGRRHHKKMQHDWHVLRCDKQPVPHLDDWEKETLFDLIHHEIVKHREEAKLRHAFHEITDAELKWSLGYAGEIDKLRLKLLPIINKS